VGREVVGVEEAEEVVEEVIPLEGEGTSKVPDAFRIVVHEEEPPPQA
jgi:hypothetical protein